MHFEYKYRIFQFFLTHASTSTHENHVHFSQWFNAKTCNRIWWLWGVVDGWDSHIICMYRSLSLCGWIKDERLHFDATSLANVNDVYAVQEQINQNARQSNATTQNELLAKCQRNRLYGSLWGIEILYVMLIWGFDIY